ncbi:MAG: hypothetical protein ACTSQY_06700, partial [Candidatus Odinarchaeia archaeon]
MASEYMIITTDGEEQTINLNEFEEKPSIVQNTALRQFILSEEIGGVRHDSPQHIKYLRQLELVDYEPA